MNQREAADVLGVHPVVLNEWLKGHKTPGLENAVGIEQVTGISVESWLLNDLCSHEAAVGVGSRKPKSAKR